MVSQPSLVAQSSLFLPLPQEKKMRTSTVIWLFALQDNLQMQVLGQVRLENDLFTLFGKKMLHTLFTVKCFNNQFSGFIFERPVLF